MQGIDERGGAEKMSFTARARSRFKKLLRRANDDGFALDLRSVDPDLVETADVERLIAAAVSGRHGRSFSQSRSAQLAQVYANATDLGKRRLLTMFATQLGPDATQLDTLIQDWPTALDESERMAAERALQQALVPRWVVLVSGLAALPDGVKFVVDLQADLLRYRDDPILNALSKQMRDLLATWFEVGFVELQEITWESTSALILERLMAYEAVHEIHSWDDLRNRLGPDRRLYGFFHPKMPKEPLIFVEIALVKDETSDLDRILDADAPDDDPNLATTAVFYSISNCQPGLAGVSFGDQLIKRVANRLSRELPNLDTFMTLSPLPGFRTWIDQSIGDPDDEVFAELRQACLVLCGGETEGALQELVAKPEVVFADERSTILREPLLRLAARYLVETKTDRGAIDRVARFHLANGARVEHLNWRANSRPQGIERSFGIMVNYRYQLDRIELNQIEYNDGHRVARSAEIDDLLT